MVLSDKETNNKTDKLDKLHATQLARSPHKVTNFVTVHHCCKVGLSYQLT